MEDKRFRESPIYLRRPLFLRIIYYLLGAYLGALGTVVIIFTWVTLFTFGWLLVFYMQEDVLFDTVSSAPVPFSAFATRLYFVMYTVSTLGMGDIVPTNNGFRIATGIASISGMLFFALIISYLLTVLPAVASMRSKATTISFIGGSPAEMIAESWNGVDFCNFEFLLGNIISELASVAQLVNLYPVVLLSFSKRFDRAFTLRMVALDEALTVFLHGARREPNGIGMPDLALLHWCRRAISMSFVDFLAKTAPAPDLSKPPPPSPLNAQVLRRMQDKFGIPVDECFDTEALDRALMTPMLANRRRRLEHYLQHSAGRMWPDIYRSEANDSGMTTKAVAPDSAEVFGLSEGHLDDQIAKEAEAIP